MDIVRRFTAGGGASTTGEGSGLSTIGRWLKDAWDACAWSCTLPRLPAANELAVFPLFGVGSFRPLASDIGDETILGATLLLLLVVVLEKRAKRGVGGPGLDNGRAFVGSGCFVFLRRKPAIARMNKQPRGK